MPTGRRLPHHTAHRTARPLAARVASALLALALPFGAAMAADDYAPVSQMLRAGRAAQALAQADRYLATRPNDPQMRFLRAQALHDTGRIDEAMATYLRLTQEHPELPEPHNNLAVLLAGRHQLEAARAALEAALRANPSYATAHENLGDIQLRLALQSWARARELDPGLSTVAPKLAAARALLQAPASAAPR